MGESFSSSRFGFPQKLKTPHDTGVCKEQQGEQLKDLGLVVCDITRQHSDWSNFSLALCELFPFGQTPVWFLYFAVLTNESMITGKIQWQT